MRKQNIVVGTVSILFGAGIILLSRDMNMYDENGILGERFWPYCLAWLFIILGVLQYIEVYKQRLIDNPPADLSSAPVRQAYWMTGVLVIYAVVLSYAGFIISSLIFIPIIMRMMGEKRLSFLCLVAVLMVACIYVAFNIIFNSPLPESIFSE